MLIFVANIVLYDIWFYFVHRLFHHPKLYKFHKEHHTHTKLTYMNSFHADIFDNVCTSFGGCILCMFGFYTYYNQIILSFVFIAIKGMMRHDDRCTFIIGNHHLLHHKHKNCNYGEEWLDYLFNTSIKTIL